MTDKDLFEIIEESKELPKNDRKALLLKYGNQAAISRIFLKLGTPKADDRTLLRALCDYCFSEKYTEIITRNITIHKEKINSLFCSDDAKTRKTLAELIGKTNPDAFFNELKHLLLTEQTEFIKASIILAIGNCREEKEAALQLLSAFRSTASEEKHKNEQLNALRKSISSLRGNAEINASINSLPPDSILVLNCPSTQVTLKEIRSLGYEAKEARFPFNTVLVYGVEKFCRIYAARSFYYASIYYGEYKSLSELEKAIQKKDFYDLAHLLFGDDTLPFRVELKCEKGFEPKCGRNKAAEKLASSADNKESKLVMSPSSYIFEIIVNITAKGILLCIAPSKRLDDRFMYKRESVPASIHPAAAAACISFIKSYTYADAAVLDCFCGSGTMLFERAKLPYKSLTGSDISPIAIKASKINEKNAKTGCTFFAKNALHEFREQYDEVICNMPFGLRVGSHDENRELYAGFLSNLKSILTERGRAFLFTNDKKLLARLIPEDFTLLAKHGFSCGGLYPTLFVLKKN